MGIAASATLFSTGVVLPGFAVSWLARHNCQPHLKSSFCNRLTLEATLVMDDSCATFLLFDLNSRVLVSGCTLGAERFLLVVITVDTDVARVLVESVEVLG